MKSNSNLSITNFKVDPTSQQISEIYINGEKIRNRWKFSKIRKL